jgi:hypothetical protein
MMIRSLLITTILLGSILAAHPAHAQSASDPSNHQNELYISWGTGSIQEIALILGSAIGAGLAGDAEMVNDESTGAIGIGYNRCLTPRWSIGLMFNFLRYSSTITSTGSAISDGYVTQMRDDMIFNDGGADETEHFDAVYFNASGKSCIPGAPAEGECRKWFGNPVTGDGQVVECFVFDDGYQNLVGPTRAIYYRGPHQMCIPDGTPAGTCRKWFGRCRVPDPAQRSSGTATPTTGRTAA